jgi:hypothetical protein
MLFALAIGCLICLTACSSEDDDQPNSPTPFATPTVVTRTPTPGDSAETGTADGFEAFLRQAEAAIAAGNFAFFANRIETAEVTCRPGVDLPACRNQGAGTVVRVFEVRTALAGSSVALPEYEANLIAWFAAARPDQSDAFGPGAPVIYATAQTPPAGGENARHAIVSAIVNQPNGQPRRVAKVFTWRFLNNRRLVYETTLDSNSPPAALSDWLTGSCAQCYTGWERWPP